MKRTAILILMAVMTLAATAQTKKHLTFQGIPINGKIAAFDAKLKAKGWKYDAKATKEANSVPGKCHCFKGTYEGMDALLSAGYSDKSRIASTVILTLGEGLSENAIKTRFVQLVVTLRNSYPDANVEDGTDYDEYEDIYLQNCTITTAEGMIYAGIKYSSGEYYIHVSYVDAINEKIYNKEFPESDMYW